MRTRACRVGFLRAFAAGGILAMAASCGGGSPGPKAGEMDASFAAAGLFTIDTDAVPGRTHVGSTADFATTDADGRVWVAGGFDASLLSTDAWAKIPVPVSRTHAVVARLLPDGRRDASFGSAGYVVDSPQGFQSQSAVVVAPRSEGGALLAEIASGWDAFFPQLIPSGRAVRFGDEGAIDGSYGTGGAAVAEFDQFMQAVVDPAGGVLFLGRRRRETAEEYHAYMELRRFDAQGGEDAGFLLRARASLDCSLLPYQSVGFAKAALQPDGRLLVAQVISPTANAPQRLCVSRLHPDGGLDVAYGMGGRVQIGEWGGGKIREVSGLSAAGDGGATLVLTVDREGTLPLAGYGVLSLTPNGEVDRSRYAGDGIGPWDHAVGWVLASAVQADGKLLVAGYQPLFSGEFRLERLGLDGRPDPGFGPGGQGHRSLDVSGWRVGPKHIHVADGAIFISGQAWRPDGGVEGTDRPRFAVLKLVGDAAR